MRWVNKILEVCFFSGALHLRGYCILAGFILKTNKFYHIWEIFTTQMLHELDMQVVTSCLSRKAKSSKQTDQEKTKWSCREDSSFIILCRWGKSAERKIFLTVTLPKFVLGKLLLIIHPSCLPERIRRVSCMIRTQFVNSCLLYMQKLHLLRPLKEITLKMTEVRQHSCSAI